MDMDSINRRVLRAHFLNSNVLVDRVFDVQKIQQHAGPLSNLYVKMGRVLEIRNLDQDKHGIRRELYEQLRLFNGCTERFEFNKAFAIMNNYVKNCWKLVRYDKISNEEGDSLKKLRAMFFGE